MYRNSHPFTGSSPQTLLSVNKKTGDRMRVWRSIPCGADLGKGRAGTEVKA